MAVPPIVIKAIATAATDKRTWKVIAVLIAAILMPVIIVILMIAALVSGTDSVNRNILDYSFADAKIPKNFTREQREAIADMREWLDELDDAIEEYDGSLDEDLVRAVFYCLQFGEELQTDGEGFDFNSFCECFEGLSYDGSDEWAEIFSEKFPQYDVGYNLKYAVGKVYEYLEQKGEL